MRSDVKMLILQGISGSGKSTYAKELCAQEPERWEIVNRDSLRFQLFAEEFEDPAYMLEEYFKQGLNWAVEEEITKREHLSIASALARGKNVIMDNTNLKKKYVLEYLKIIIDMGYNPSMVYIKRFDIESVNVAFERIQGRGERFVDKEVLRRQMDTYRNTAFSIHDFGDSLRYYRPKKWYLPHFSVKPYDVQKVLDSVSKDFPPKAIICDLDGTLAHRRLQYKPNIHYRSFYAYEECETDKPDFLVSQVLRALKKDGVKIIFVSGRKSDCKEDTRAFIRRATDFSDSDYELYMRDEQIDRHDGKDDPDDEVKYRLFNKYIRDNYLVIGVIDDRKRVVALWEQLGLRVLNVGLLNDEF